MKWYLDALKKYAVFSGRARRKEYWYFALFYFLLAIIIAFIGIYIRIPVLYTLFVLAMLIPSLAVGVRRMHDVNKSGWFLLIPIYSLILAFTDGNQGPNRYGSDPKRPEFEEFLSDAEPVQSA
jgi:uncharacterized membrane protein YhaH (DUF805 family)